MFSLLLPMSLPLFFSLFSVVMLCFPFSLSPCPCYASPPPTPYMHFLSVNRLTCFSLSSFVWFKSLLVSVFPCKFVVSCFILVPSDSSLCFPVLFYLTVSFAQLVFLPSRPAICLPVLCSDSLCGFRLLVLDLPSVPYLITCYWTLLGILDFDSWRVQFFNFAWFDFLPVFGLLLVLSTTNFIMSAAHVCLY